MDKEVVIIVTIQDPDLINLSLLSIQNGKVFEFTQMNAGIHF